MARKKTRYRQVRRASLSTLRHVIYGVLPLFFFLSISELLARVCWIPEPSTSSTQTTVMEPHPTRLWAPRPGPHTAFGAPFEIGANFLRKVELAGANQRIITLGDSSIFGHGVEDEWTLHRQLQAALQARSLQADVLCGGIPGYSTEQSLRLMEEWGWQQEPTLLIIGNLWSDGARSTVPDREWYALYESPTARFDQFLMSWSTLWRWIRSHASKQTETPVELIFERLPEGERRVPLADYAENLDRLLEQAADRGVSAILLSPCHEKMLVDPDYQERLQDVGYFGAMRAVAAHRGIPLVSACDVIRNAGITDREQAFVMMDPSRPQLGNDPLHPSGLSNQAYAAEITTVLMEHGWPSKSLLPRPEVGTFSQSLLPGPESL